MAKAWSEVEQSQEYQALPSAQKAAAKQEYWDTVVSTKPEYRSLPPAGQLGARAQFFGSGGQSVMPNSQQAIIGKDPKTGKPVYDPVALAYLKSQAVNLNKPNSVSLEEKGKAEIKKDVAKNAMERVQKLQELIPVLDQFEGYMEAIPVSTGVGGRMEGLGKIITSPLQTDPFVATALTQIDALRPQIARGFGDVGNLSKPEQETAKQFIKQTADSADTRALKGLGGLTFIRRKIQNAVLKAGLQDDTNYLNTLNELDKRISDQFAKALKLGVDGERLSKFLNGAQLTTSEIPMTPKIASTILELNGNNKEKARKAAKSMGLKF